MRFATRSCAVAWPGQDLVPADTVFEEPLAGLSAVGFTLWDRSRFLPLLVTKDRYNRNCGWACATLVHYAGKYRGGCWLLSGITTPAFYRSAAFERCLIRFLAAAAERDLPRESALHNQRRQAAKLPLVTPSPPGLTKSLDGRRFMTADGKPFFLIGADYIGSLDRKFFGGPWLWWLESDFRRARDAGLNCLRIYGAGELWRDPQKLAALKECARKYRIYLLIVVGITPTWRAARGWSSAMRCVRHSATSRCYWATTCRTNRTPTNSSRCAMAARLWANAILFGSLE